MNKRGGAAGRGEKKRVGGKEKLTEHAGLGGPASWALLSCLCTPQLADIILTALSWWGVGRCFHCDQKGASVSPSLCLSTHRRSLPKRRPSPKSPLFHVSRSWEAPGIPLRSFPWSLGSSLCHVAQSEPSLSRITQLSMGGQMTIIRLHSSGPYLKRQKRSPGDLR